MFVTRYCRAFHEDIGLVSGRKQSLESMLRLLTPKIPLYGPMVDL